jgi:hypothetical protein
VQRTIGERPVWSNQLHIVDAIPVSCSARQVVKMTNASGDSSRESTLGL